MKTSLSGDLYFTSKLCLKILKFIFVFLRTAYSDFLYCFQFGMTFKILLDLRFRLCTSAFH